MAEIKNKLVTVESLLALHEYNELTYTQQDLDTSILNNVYTKEEVDTAIQTAIWNAINANYY